MAKTKRNRSMNDLYPYKKDKDGKPLCRYCGGKVKSPRRTWCSQECVNAALLKTDYKTKKDFVYSRDKGICQICSADLDNVKKSYSNAKRRLTVEYNRRKKELKDWYHSELDALNERKRALLPNNRKSYWDMDHVVPLVEGGSDDVDNLRVLCISCHKEETSKLASRIASKNKK